jgi:hypothetical protein
LGPDDVGSEGFHSPSEGAIRGNESDLLIGGMCDDVDERVITTPVSVDDEHALGRAGRCAGSCRTLKDDGYRLVEASGSSCRSHLVHERSGGARTIPPPARRPRSHHVCHINDQHDASLIHRVRG